jgi:hypothetical protein
MSANNDFLVEMLRDLSKRVDSVSDNVTVRMDGLQQEMRDQHNDMREYLENRIEPIQEIVNEHEKRIVKHDHVFGAVGWFVTVGLAAVATVVTWLQSIASTKH